LGVNLQELVQQVICGGLAAAGFGLLFNVRFPALVWCGASGALALGVRMTALGFGWSVEGASFAAALTVGAAVHLFPQVGGVSRNALHVAGCIPMLPGAFAAKAILQLFAFTTQHSEASNQILISAIDNSLRVAFTIGAIGTGLAVPELLLRVRRVKS
jgi:uncharacterized membrane protein YjjB (DUF3815 family)